MICVLTLAAVQSSCVVMWFFKLAQGNFTQEFVARYTVICAPETFGFTGIVMFMFLPGKIYQLNDHTRLIYALTSGLFEVRRVEHDRRMNFRTLNKAVVVRL